jgi:hypothetical protein
LHATQMPTYAHYHRVSSSVLRVSRCTPNVHQSGRSSSGPALSTDLPALRPSRGMSTPPRYSRESTGIATKCHTWHTTPRSFNNDCTQARPRATQPAAGPRQHVRRWLHHAEGCPSGQREASHHSRGHLPSCSLLPRREHWRLVGHGRCWRGRAAASSAAAWA